MEDEKKQVIKKLSEASPLEATQILQEMELYDAKSAQEIIDEVYEQFTSGKNMKEEILKPVFGVVLESVFELTTMGKSLRKKGLTATRFMKECDDFSYVEGNSISDVNGYVEYKNARDYTIAYGEENRPNFDRSKYENQNSMNNYKKNKVEENNGNKNLKDEYTDQRNITAHRNNSDERRNDPKHDYQAEPDHIVPLKQIHNQFKRNYALSDEDIKRIANSDDNLALTSGALNGRKLDSINTKFIKEQEKLKKEGKPYYKLDEETKKLMIQKEKDAEQDLNSNVNHTVKDNLLGKGAADRQARKDSYKEEEERVGRKLTQNERTEIDKKLSGNKQKEILGTGVKNATNQAKDYAVGNLILYIVKPIYYELSDIFKNGIQEGVSASSTTEAIKIRFSRVKKYVLENSVGFLGDNLWEFAKGFVSSLIEGIISLFVGIFKQILKVIKEGIKIFVQSAKILFGKDSKDMSPAEKGDVIIKLIGGSIIAISGIGIEFLLNKVGIGDPWSVVLSTMLSGIAAALFMYALEKADIFSVKAEKRRDRIIEIFDERIKDINEAADSCNIVAIETFKRQRVEFETINEQIDIGMKQNNIIAINDGLYRMADFMKVDLPYSNTEEFCDYMDSEEVLLL